MSTSGDQREHDELPLPEEARSALRRRGDQLLGQLDSMRQEDAERIEIEPLDPQAELALRQRGDELLNQLAAERSAIIPAAPRRKWRRLINIAALFVGFLGITWMTAISLFPEPPSPPSNPPITPLKQTHAGQLTSPAIPEPSSSLLALLGGAWLIGRRQRPKR